MNILTIIIIKGMATCTVGALFTLIPTRVVAVMGGTLEDAGAVMLQLFGLVLLVVGWGMINQASVPAGSEALATAIADTAAATLLILAGYRRIFGFFGYGLAAIYLLSAWLFFYCYLA